MYERGCAALSADVPACQSHLHLESSHLPSISALLSTGATMLSEQHVLDSAASCSTHVNVFFEISIKFAHY